MTEVPGLLRGYAYAEAVGVNLAKKAKAKRMGERRI